MIASTLMGDTKGCGQNYEKYDHTTTQVNSLPDSSSPSEYSLVSVQGDDEVQRLMVAEFGASYREAIKDSSNTMIPMFSSSPTGNESGIFLAIDLGGSTLRVAIIRVADKRTQNISENSWLVKDDQKVIDESFFNMMAVRIDQVVKSQDVVARDSVLHCGITWSFPLKQTKPNNGLIENVGKGYKLTPYSAGKDLKTLLERACQNNGLSVSVDAIINDSSSVFIAGKFLHDSKIGLVLGTGTNAAFSIPSQTLSCNKRVLGCSEDCLLNSELSFFGYNLRRFTNKYDFQIDQRWNLDFNVSTLPHMGTEEYGVFQPLELMTAGRYISELLRLEIIDKLKFSVDKLHTPYGLDAYYICEIYENKNFQPICNDFALVLTENDKLELAEIVNQIIERAICVLGLAINALAELILEHYTLEDSEVIKIGYIGSILQYFHTYRAKLEEFMNTQFFLKVEFVYIENSSVAGAAIAASVNNHNE